MADHNDDIDIDMGRTGEDQEMDIDTDANTVIRRGRGFRGNTGHFQQTSGNAKFDGPPNPSHATAVRCTFH